MTFIEKTSSDCMLQNSRGHKKQSSSQSSQTMCPPKSLASLTIERETDDHQSEVVMQASADNTDVKDAQSESTQSQVFTRLYEHA